MATKQITCASCGKPFEYAPPKYCSRACQGIGKQRHYLIRIERYLRRFADPSQCWIWTGYTNQHGYGRLRHGTTTVLAHRAAWELAHGPIPEGLNVLHNCPDGDNPSCINVAHLFLGTQIENVADMMRKGRMPMGAARWNAKFTEDDVRAIRQSTEHAQTLADRFGVRRAEILRIRRRVRWAHVV